MSKDSLVSIITPMFNDEKFIRATYASIVNQTYKNWEWIITDDCSTDSSYSIVRDLAKADSRIILLNNESNSGAAIARNSSINKAMGKYIAFLDADDIWESNKLEKQIDFMICNNVYLCYSDYRHIDELGSCLNYIRRTPNQVSYASLLKENVLGCLTVVYDAEEIGKFYMPIIRKRQDFGLWLTILKTVGCAKKVPWRISKVSYKI
ncbi:glycosyltransferase family 2 protein [Vibrio cyclitrophicus]|uniref:glycosyltransferase family 2 protein n=1 Tax=Vibrio cyclitrophicus TaxID=47951 RepID=UPI00399B8F0C